MLIPRSATWSEAYRRMHEAPKPPPQIRWVACAFSGCICPPAFESHSKYCHAHHKQRERGGPLRPFKPRSDVEARWERWAKRRVERVANAPSPLGLVHPRCGSVVRVLATHPNGKRGWRYCYCATCGRRLLFDPRGRFVRETGKRRGGQP